MERTKWPSTPSVLADDIWASLIESLGLEPKIIPDEFLNISEETKEITLPVGGSLQVSTGGLFDEEGNGLRGRIGRTLMTFSSSEEMDLVGLLAKYHLSGRIRIPVEPQRCAQLLHELSRYLERVHDALTEAVSQLTTDEETRKRIVREGWKQLRSPREH